MATWRSSAKRDDNGDGRCFCPEPGGATSVISRTAALSDLGDLSLFVFSILRWSVRRPGRGTLLPIFYEIGILSIPVVFVNGMFIGMVLAVQSYASFNQFGMATRLGAMINVSVVRELGPVLAAVMLAGRVGGSMAAELATMRITEQIDALSCLGAHPIHYLVVPRLLACVLLIPLLTIMANFMGIMGGALVTRPATSTSKPTTTGRTPRASWTCLTSCRGH